MKLMLQIDTLAGMFPARQCKGFTMLITIDIEVLFDETEEILRETEAIVIKQVMEACQWNQSKTAKRLGISRGGLRLKLEDYFPGKYTTKRGK